MWIWNHSYGLWCGFLGLQCFKGSCFENVCALEGFNALLHAFARSANAQKAHFEVGRCACSYGSNPGTLENHHDWIWMIRIPAPCLRWVRRPQPVESVDCGWGGGAMFGSDASAWGGTCWEPTPSIGPPWLYCRQPRSWGWHQLQHTDQREDLGKYGNVEGCTIIAIDSR